MTAKDRILAAAEANGYTWKHEPNTEEVLDVLAFAKRGRPRITVYFSHHGFVIEATGAPHSAANKAQTVISHFTNKGA